MESAVWDFSLSKWESKQVIIPITSASLAFKVNQLRQGIINFLTDSPQETLIRKTILGWSPSESENNILQLEKVDLTCFKTGDFYRSHVDPMKYSTVVIGHFPVYSNSNKSMTMNINSYRGGELEFLCSDSDSRCISIPTLPYRNQLIAYSMKPHLAPHRLKKIEKKSKIEDENGEQYEDKKDFFRFGFIAYYL